MNQIKFVTKGNAKLKDMFTFSLISGYSCPFADECLSKANIQTGKISDGPNTKFRCFSASQEALYPNLRKHRNNNFEALRKLKSKEAMAKALIEALPPVKKNGAGTIIRLHVAGDFFNQNYFDAWLEVARQNPKRLFYAYTKSLQYWVNRIGEIPNNFKLTASKGGKLDHLIDIFNLKYVEVVFSTQEAIDKDLEIDHDDSHAYNYDLPFTLLIHGTQPKGSKAAEAKKLLAKKGWTGYHN